MFFQKNLPAVERACRVCIGLIILCGGLFFAPDDWMKWSAIAVGAIAACTGFVGFCPMCAMVGRKL